MPGDGTVWSVTPGSLVRRPRLRFTVNGQPLVGCYEASVSANNRLAADTWEAALAMDADPGYGWAFWGDQRDATISVEAAFLAATNDLRSFSQGASEGSVAAWTSLITGKVDDVHVDPAQGTVHLAGRDLTSLLIDTKIQEAFPNEKTSQILTRFAQEHGLKADVTPTTALVGSYYKDEHDKLSLGNFSKQTSEWELACYLVRQEDQDIWIDSQGLHTRPAVDPEGSNAQPFPIIYIPRDTNTPISTSNIATDVQCERSLTLAKDVRVIVKSWDAAHKTAYTRTVDGKGSVTAASGSPGISAGGPGSRGTQSHGKTEPAQTYVFVKPGLTPDQALRFAQQQARVLTLLERVVTVEMPGELDLTPRSLVALSGTGTSWDQVYYVDTLTRRISLSEGFRQTVRLKNSSPRTMTTVP